VALCLPSLSNRTAMIKNVLGISAGTRSFGYAIVRNEELVEWEVKNFPGKWSKLKLRIIGRAFENLLAQKIDAVAFKTTLPFHSSQNLDELNSALAEIASLKNIPASFYSAQDLLKRCNVTSKKKMIEAISQGFPEIIRCKKGVHPNCQRTEMKLFEAVGCTLCMLRPN
jgi:hypothetical protein